MPSTAPLIDVPRARENATLAALETSNSAYLNSLLSAASASIRRYCGREFTAQTLTEYYSGGAYLREPLQLRQFPVTEITRLCTAQRCLQILNNGNGGAVQRATVETVPSSTAGAGTASVKLVSVASGVSTSTTLLLSTYTTVGTLAAAVNALGAGWSTAIFSGSAGSYTNFPSADLKPLQGAFSALVAGCYLDIFEDWYGTNNAGWTDDDCDGAWGGSGNNPLWRLDGETGKLFGRFPRGQMNLAVSYVSGFATIPGDVQEAVCQMAQFLYQTSTINSAMQSYRIGDEAMVLRDKWPHPVKNLLAPYVDHGKTIFYGL
jgi:hypothetical protein